MARDQQKARIVKTVKDTPEISPQLQIAPDANLVAKIPASIAPSADLQIAPDTTQPLPRKTPLVPSTDLQIAPDAVRPLPRRAPIAPDPNLQIAPDATKPVFLSQNKLDVSSLAVADDAEQRRFEMPFTGAWLPKGDPLAIGQMNFSEIENFRYNDFGLEGVGGFTKINTIVPKTAGDALLSIKNGIHFKSPYDDVDYLIAQMSDVSISNNKLMLNTSSIPVSDPSTAPAQFDAFTIVTGVNDVMSFTSDESSPVWIDVTLDAGYYASGAELLAELRDEMNDVTELTGGATITFSVSYDSSAGTFTIDAGSGHTIDLDVSESNAAQMFGFTVDTVAAQTITSDSRVHGILYNEAYSDLARFAMLPRSTMLACDGDHNLIWSGYVRPAEAVLTGTLNTVAITADNNTIKVTSSQSTPTVREISVGAGVSYTADEYAYALETALNADDTLTGTGEGAITFYVENHCGKLYIYVDTGTFSIGGDPDGDGQAIAGFTTGVTGQAATYICPEFFGHRWYFSDSQLDDVTNQAKNDLTDAANLISIGGWDDDRFMLIGSARPLRGFRIGVATANTATSTMLGFYFDGEMFTEVTGLVDGTSAGGVSLAQSGDVAFLDTAAAAEPMLIGGKYLYYYMFYITDVDSDAGGGVADAALSSIMCLHAVTELRDIWDGDYRTCLRCLYALANSLTDYTLEMQKESYAAEEYYLPIVADSASGFIFVMFSEPMAALYINVKSNNDDVTTMYMEVAEYIGTGDYFYDGFSAVSVHTNTIKNDDSLGSGVVAWDESGDEKRVEKYGAIGYVYRVRFLTQDGGTAHVFDEAVNIDTITGIPRARTIQTKYKFGLEFNGRSLLCGAMSDNEPNRIDYSMPNAPDVYNGTDASGRFNERSLYIGNDDELMAGASLYNVYGESAYTAALLFKQSKTYLLTGDSPTTFRVMRVSDSIGCPAPLTVTPIETIITDSNVMVNVVMWLSDKGPMMFSGYTIRPVPGMEIYFEHDYDTCITQSAFADARAWFDPAYKSWNLTFRNSSGLVHIAYDLMRNKWYHIVPDSDLFTDSDVFGAIPVTDANGVQYNYGYSDGGHLLRLEYGLSWADSDDTPATVQQKVATSDFFLTGSMWDDVLISFLQTAFKANADGDIFIEYYKDRKTAAETGDGLPTDSNLITDGLMEVWASASNLTNWTESVTGTSTINRDSDNKHRGNYSVRFDIDGSNSIVNLSQAVTLEASTEYTFDFYHMEEAGATMNAQLRDGQGTPNYMDDDGNWSTDAAYLTVQESSAFGRYSITFTTPAWAGPYRVLFTRGTATSKSIWIDSAHIYKGRAARHMALTGYNVRHLINSINLIGWSHKFEYTIKHCSSTKPVMLGAAVVFSKRRDAVLDADDYA
jgi:hypothetical protein